MKIGVIARCEVARGLAIQSKNFHDNIPVDRVLLVTVRRPHCDICPEWYPGHTLAAFNDEEHQLAERPTREWMEGLDVIFTVETPYDWRLPDWARSMGVKTVIQGNPEFYAHWVKGQEWRAQPDEWWWPTSWRPTKVLPQGRLMPVPMPDVPVVASTATDGPLKVLHVVGKRAHGDRNGTDILVNAMRFVTEPMHLTMYGLDGQLPDVPRHPLVTTELYPDGVEDRWSMYEGQHVLMLPRRYGGLCLPALEAKASGLVVAMPETPPNRELATLLFGPCNQVPMQLPCGEIKAVKPKPAQVSRLLDNLSIARAATAFGQMRDESLRTVPRWSEWQARYIEAFEQVIGG